MHKKAVIIKKACFILLIMSAMGCKRSADVTSPVVARVYEHVLTAEELRAKMPASYAAQDSARLADQIVNNWVRDKALLSFAEEHLSSEQKDFSKELEDYRNSLIIYAYERELINQKLDTAVSEEDLKAYYEANIDNFKLRNYIVKLRFLKLSPDAPEQAKLQKWWEGGSQKDMEELYDYCMKYCENYYLDEDTWLYLQDVLKEVPIPTTDWDNFLQNTTYYTFESNGYKYYVRFYDYKLKDDTAPYSLERERIKDLIVNKRKVELLNALHSDVLQDAYAKNKILVSGEKSR